MRFAFTDEVGNGRGEHQNLEGGHAALFVDAFEQVLRNNAFECFRKRGANFVLLFGREHVDDTIDRLGRAGSMQCAEDKVTGTGRDEGQLDGFQIAQLADQDDIRVFTQGAAQRRGETLGVNAHFAVVYQAVLALVNKFNWVLDSNDMVAAVLVAIIDHCRKRRRFA